MCVRARERVFLRVCESYMTQANLWKSRDNIEESSAPWTGIPQTVYVFVFAHERVCAYLCHGLTQCVCVCVCVCVSGAPVCAEGERVKPIDYFNPPICESVILSAQPSTGGLLIGLNASLLSCALPVQLT